MSSPLFPDLVYLTAEARVNGEKVSVYQVVDSAMYDNDPVVQEEMERHLRRQLVEAILEKWKPRVRASR